MLRFAFLFPCLVLTMNGCLQPREYSPLLQAEPAPGATLSRAPRTLRLYYDALPDVSRSSLSLTGPGGEYPLRGLHTMAADDLMIEIMEPLTPGEYEVQWATVVGDDSTLYSGSYSFSVVRP